MLKYYPNSHGESCDFCHRMARYDDGESVYCSVCARQQYGDQLIDKLKAHEANANTIIDKKHD